MNDEYALDPALGSRVRELKFLFRLFGFTEGRFLARFPKAWSQLALSTIADQSTRHKAQILFQRARSKGAFVPSKRPFSTNCSWIENAIAQQRTQRPFSKIIVHRAHQECETLDDVDPADFAPSRDIRCIGNVANFLTVLQPLLSTAGSLYLVDPYFKPWTATTRDLLNRVLAIALCGRLQAFEAYVSAAEWGDAGEAEVKAAVTVRNSASTNFTVFGCDHGIHQRYLFSEKGGVRLDRGLQTSRGLVDMSYVDGTVHGDLLATYVEKPRTFRVVKRVAVCI